MYVLIVNPVSGRGKALRLLPEIEAEFARRGLDYSVKRTTGPTDAASIARAAAANRPDGIVAVGGDGSFFEVVNGMAGSDVPLLFVPCGTGNDFVKSLPLPKDDPLAALRAQLDAPPSRIDLGRMNDTFFLNVSGTGFDVDVLRLVDRHKQNHGGLSAYLFALRDALKDYRPTEAAISFDGGTEERVSFAILSIGNGRYFGGGMKAVPEAKVDDGLFDVVIVSPVRKIAIPPLIAFFIAGMHIRLGLAKRVRCKRFTLLRSGMTVNLDGELRPADEANYELLPAALCVRLPKNT